MPETFDFAEALKRVIAGSPHGITRLGWHGVGLCVLAQFPDANSKMTQPYLYLSFNDGRQLPWVPSQGDLFATDWMEGRN